jgi:hypothetical protein
VADSYAGLQVIDISDPTNPTIIGTVDTPGFANSVFISGNNAYVADWDSGLQVIAVSDPTNPTIIGTVDTPYAAREVHVTGNYAYVADLDGLQVIDVSDPANSAIVGSVDTWTWAGEIHVSGSYAYVIGSNQNGVPGGLQVLRAFEPCTNVAITNSTKITATVPADLPEGTHNLHVVNPKGERAILHNSFTVQSGLCPDISCSTTSHDFGIVNVGSTSRQRFEITNMGNADLMIGSLSITGADASQFTIENDYCSGQFCVPSGTLTVDIIFSPDAVGTKSANLSIPSNDPDTALLNVALTGTATPEEPPTVDLKVNGKDGPVVVTSGETVNFTYSLDPGSMEGMVCDWWFVIIQYLPPPMTPSVLPLGQGPLVVVPETLLFSGPLPSGVYAYLFVLDDTPDGSYETTWYDKVVVVSRRAGASLEPLPDFDSIFREEMKKLRKK